MTNINTELRQLESMIDRSFEVASQHLTAEDIADVKRSMTATLHRVKTAGEVKFVKEWEQNDSTARNFDGGNWEPDKKAKKTMAKALWSLAMAFGHLHTGYRIFSKVRASSISPDGLMGGRGYIKTVPEMRTQMAQAVEILSSVTDTLHDDLKGPHMDRIRSDVDTTTLVAEAEKVMDNPEDASEIEDKSTVADDVAEEAKESPDQPHNEQAAEAKEEGGSKAASRQHRIASRLASKFVAADEDWPSGYFTREHQFAPLEEPDDFDDPINEWSSAFSASIQTVEPMTSRFEEDVEFTDDFGVGPRDDEAVDFLRSRP